MRRIAVVAVVTLALVASTAVVYADSGKPKLNRQPTPEAVVAEHIDALNDCSVERLMALYPEGVVILFPGGVTVEGREAVRALFEGFCQPFPPGLKGLTFTEVKTWTVGKTINQQWVATAPFLAGPYYGFDAYETEAGLMAAQATSFDAADMVFAGP